MVSNTPPAALSIAGLDPSSGAGFTADLKVFAAHGLYGLACPTALTVQSTVGVRRNEPVEPALVTDTLACLAEDMPIAGVKIGMLGSAAVAGAVAQWLRTRCDEAVPVVLDPVLRSTSGHALLDPEGMEVLKAELLPLARVITPNLAEAALLSGTVVETREAMECAARALQRCMAPGRGAVVITGGHLRETGQVEDFLLQPGDQGGSWLSGPRVLTRSTHGTGCAFSSALLAGLVLGQELPSAVRSAKEYVRAALENSYPLGRGRGPMHHLFASRAFAPRSVQAPKASK